MFSPVKLLSILLILQVSKGDHLSCSWLDNNATNVVCKKTSNKSLVYNEELSSQIPEMATVKLLVLEHCNIVALDKEAYLGLADLRILRLSYNKIRTINEESFKNLTVLKKLFLASNEITTLEPKVFEPLSNLKRLILKNNNIETLDPEIFSTNEILSRIDLSYNKLTTLPEDIFVNNTKLRKLDLSFNDLKIFPLNLLSSLSRLTALLVNGCQFNVLPPAFQQAPDVERLDLSGNSIDELSNDYFQTFAKLKHLDLSNNSISVIHQETFKNVYLSYLDLSYNRIRNGGWISKIFQDKVRGLNVSHNRIETLGRINPKAISFLDISFNKITTLHDNTFNNVENIYNLTLSGNDLSTFPNAAVASLKTLRRIHLVGCRLDKLPEGLQDLDMLKMLDAGHNTIEEIPEDYFSNLVKLRVLILKNNNIKEINEDTFSELENLIHLDVSYNNINDASFITSLEQLEDLNLSFNRIAELPELDLPALLMIDVSNNNLKELGTDFPDTLQTVLMMSNPFVCKRLNGTLEALRSKKIRYDKVCCNKDCHDYDLEMKAQNCKCDSKCCKC